MATIDLTKRGPAGIDGTAIASGHGNPRASFGVEGWLYVNLSSTALFRKENGVWVAKFFMKGLKGDAGKRGISLRSGSGAPSDEVGNPGDAYFNVLNGDVYGPKASNGTWPASPVGSLRGPQGVQGIQGIQGIQGNVGAQGVQGIPGTPGTSVSPLVYAQLNKILASANDIAACFIYDTRRDSDLGWWRFKCQGKSWYNETLGTATRGMRKEFPAVVAIVLRASSFIIYDLTDLDGTGIPRMWMVVPSANFYSSSALGVRAINGRIYIAGNASGLLLYDFVDKDEVGRFLTGGYQRTAANIASRATAATLTTSVSGIVSNTVNDVSVRAIAGSPTDAMGLTIPTVAVATAAGTSVILPSGVVWDITDANGADAVLFLSDNRLWIGASQTGHDARLAFGPIPTADIAVTSWRLGIYHSVEGNGQALSLIPSLGSTADALAVGAVGQSVGLVKISENVATPAQGMVSYIAINYATGWLPGDTRGAYICDGVTGNLVGANVYSNDGTDTTGFSGVNGGVVSTSGGALIATDGGTSNAGIRKVLSGLTAGQTYVVNASIKKGAIGTAARLDVDAVSSRNITSTSFTPISLQFVAGGTTANLTLYALGTGGSGNTAELDNISIDVAVPDRSSKSIGLVAVGTLSRTAVNTGADVVLIGNSSSASNYLEQPYNSDLDYGTGDFQWSGVVHSDNATASTRVILDRYDGSTTASRFRVYINSSHQLVAHVGGTFLTGTSAVNTGQPVRWRVVRRSGSLELWVNGVLENSTANSSNLTLANAILRFFQDTDGTSQFGMGSNGKGIGRITTSAYAPTAAQIALADRDEASILQPDAKAFLGGTSNAVQALDYDPDRNVLAVGTADGVSEFSGLRRFGYFDTTNCALTNDNMKCVSRRDGFRLYGGGADIIANRDLSFTSDDDAMRAAYLRTLIPDTSLFATSAALAALSATVAGITVPVKGAGTDYWTGTDDAKFMTAKALRDAGALVPIASAATINLNGNSGLVFDLVLDHNASFALPTNLKNGETYTIIITQGTTGGTGAFNGAYDFRGVTPTLSVGAGKIDIVSGVYKASSGKLISSFSNAV